MVTAGPPQRGCSMVEADCLSWPRRRRGRGIVARAIDRSYSPVVALFEKVAQAGDDRGEAIEPLGEFGVKSVVRRAFGKAVVKVMAVRDGSYGNLRVEVSGLFDPAQSPRWRQKEQDAR